MLLTFMKRNRVFPLILTIGLPTAPLNQAWQTPPTGRISPKEILDKYLEAGGGVERRRSLQTLVASGDFGLNLLRPLGNFRFSYKAPSSDVFELQMISHGESWAGRRNDHFFRRSTVGGPAMLNGIGIWILEQSWRSLLEWEFSKDYTRIELIGLAKVNKKLTYALRFTPRNGDPQIRYFDTESFLMVRLDQVQRFRDTKTGPEMAYRLESYYSDYRDVDGITLPRTISINRAEGDFLFAATSVKTGIDVDDSVFNRDLER